MCLSRCSLDVQVQSLSPPCCEARWVVCFIIWVVNPWVCRLKPCCWLCSPISKAFSFTFWAPVYNPPLLHLDTLLQCSAPVVCSCACVYVGGRDSERSHLSLAVTPPAPLHTINRNWDRHTHSSSHSLQRQKKGWRGYSCSEIKERWESSPPSPSLLSPLPPVRHRRFAVKESDSLSWRALRHLISLSLLIPSIQCVLGKRYRIALFSFLCARLLLAFHFRA